MVTIASRSSNSPPSRASTSRSSVAAARVASPWLSSPATESSSSSRASWFRVSRSSSRPWSRATVSRSPSTAASRRITRRARSGSSHRLGPAACSRRPASSRSLPARSKELLRVGEPLCQRLQLGSVVGGHGSRVSSGRVVGAPTILATRRRSRLGGRPLPGGGARPLALAAGAERPRVELQEPPVEVSRRSRLLWNSSTHSAVSCCMRAAMLSETARSRARRVWACLGVDGAGGAAGALGRPVVLKLLEAALQGLGGGHGAHPARGDAEEPVEADAGGGQGEEHVAPGGAAGPGGGGVEQGLEAARGDQEDDQQAQPPRPDALAPLVGQVPVDGVDRPGLGVAVEPGQGGLGVLPLLQGGGRDRPGPPVAAASPSVGPRSCRRRLLHARGGFPDRHPPPPRLVSPTDRRHRRILVKADLTSWESGRALRSSPPDPLAPPSEVPCPCSVPHGWSSSCSSSPWSAPPAGRSRPAGPLPRARPARPAASSRPTPTPATTPPPTATAARPRTPRRSPRATGSSS